MMFVVPSIGSDGCGYPLNSIEECSFMTLHSQIMYPVFTSLCQCILDDKLDSKNRLDLLSI